MKREAASSALRLIIRPVLTMMGDTIRMTFARNKKVIRYEVAAEEISGTIYYHRSDVPAPAVLLLPTSMGLTPHEHVMAARLAREGFTTLALGYTRRTTGAVVKDEQMRRHLEQVVLLGWRKLLNDPRANGTRAGVIGFSLGGYFATYIATADPKYQPKAGVIYYGVYTGSGGHQASLRTPLLVLQGETDEAEFVNNAKALRERHSELSEVIFYPDTGHQFDLFESNSAATKDAWKQTVRFLKEHLK
jgi:dienelactone hydrolase